MDRELIERLTEEAVARVGRGPAWRLVFARSVAEECAKICEERTGPRCTSRWLCLTAAAEAIRERFKV